MRVTKKRAILRVIPDATFPGMFFCAAAAWWAFLARRVLPLEKRFVQVDDGK
jgi:hypothetical protein